MAKKSPLRDSHAAIFVAAAQEFAEHGYEAAGVDRIAAAARVNKAMLYYHFGKKSDLYVEVLRDAFRAVGARVRAIADGPGTAPEKLDIWIQAVVEEAGLRPWFPPMMLRELASGGAHLDPDTVEMMNAVVQGVADILAQGEREGAFRPTDPLMTHLTIMPPILMFFARERVVAARRAVGAIAAPLHVDAFVRHIQGAVQRMLRKDL